MNFDLIRRNRFFFYFGIGLMNGTYGRVGNRRFRKRRRRRRIIIYDRIESGEILFV